MSGEGEAAPAAAAPAEAPAGPAEQSTTAGEASVSVGVLGWLGFIIINWAAWGIISTASFITWVFGFIICFFYTCGLVGLALWLERRDKVKYRQFMNLLWVLACSFTFILGAYIAIQVIGPAFRDDTVRLPIGADGNGGGSSNGNGMDVSRGSVAGLLPSNSSADLLAWASASRWQTTSSYGAFGSSMYFSGKNEWTNGDNILFRTAGSNANEVAPWLRMAKYFEQYSSDLYFLAQDNTTRQTGLWKITSGSPESATEALSRSDMNISTGDLTSVAYDPDSDALYLKGEYRCNTFIPGCWTWVYTVFKSDGTPAGTTDLRGSDICTSVCDESSSGGGGGGGGPGGPDKPPTAEMWAVIFLGILPMMLLAGFVVIKKQLPGPFVNLYGGFEGAVILLFLLFATEDAINNDFLTFMKWFITSYNTVFWFVLAFWSLARESIPEWQEELKSWAVVFVGVSFFVVIHIDLEIPFREDAWRWIVYALLTVVQLLLSAIVSRTVPMVAGAVGLFVLAWKIAYEIVRFAAFEDSGEFFMLSVLIIMAVQGAGIVLGAIWYSSQREKLDAMVVALLRCQTAKVKELRGQDWVTPGSNRVDV